MGISQSLATTVPMAHCEVQNIFVRMRELFGEAESVEGQSRGGPLAVRQEQGTICYTHTMPYALSSCLTGVCCII